MLVWIYAGGVPTEAVLGDFLTRHFLETEFVLKTPYLKTERDRPPRPNSPPRTPKNPYPQYAGHSGDSFAKSLTEELRKWDGSADVMLIIDDLDCYDAEKRKELFASVAKKIPPQYTVPTVIIGLAAPEVEAWLIADWDNTIGNRFSICGLEARRLLEQRGVQVEQPEDFPCRDENGQSAKISVLLQDSINTKCDIRYSKGKDTPDLLLQINPDNVAAKCPRFREFWQELKRTLELATT